MEKLTNNKILIGDIRSLIDQSKQQLSKAVNASLTLTYWHIGKRINEDVLNNERASYGKEVVKQLAIQLVEDYGKSFEARNLRRMMQFAELFPDIEKVSPLVTQLSWTHFITLISVRDKEARWFYAKQSAESLWSKRELQKQIENKVYGRKETANTKNQLTVSELKDSFKDPYFLDFLGLKDGYLENDLENAIIKELELFILELGKGFAFVDRQKRMIIDGEDFYLDLLFYHRKLKRLVAIELKLGRFKAALKGQMELYLNWLHRHETEEGENPPIGLILCAEAGAEQIELLHTQKDNIMVAEYWTQLPAKELLEKKLHKALMEVRERMSVLNSDFKGLEGDGDE